MEIEKRLYIVETKLLCLQEEVQVHQKWMAALDTLIISLSKEVRELRSK
jgi:hypothetical protein